MAVGPSRISTLTFTTDLSPHGVPVIEDRFYRVHRFREGSHADRTASNDHGRSLSRFAENWGVSGIGRRNPALGRL